MPTTRAWIGGDDDNQASDPNNWVDPNGQPGAPQAGDTLIMNSGTMNVSDHDLEGDTLVVGSTGSIPPPVINLTNADVTLQGSSNGLHSVSFTLNARGDDSLTVINPTDPSSGLLVHPTINLVDNAHLLMQGEMRFAGGYDFNGGPGSEIINEGSIIGGRAISHTINTNIVGDGLIEVDPATGGPALYTINGRVGGGQTFELTRTALYPATLDIKQPHTFHGLIDAPPDVLVRANVILEGLTATSYSVKGDILQLYNCNKRVDTLRLSNPADQPLSVGQSGSNVVLAFNGTAPGDILPIHGFS